MTFTENDKLKALAIVHIFETSRPFGDYAACAVLNDGAGVSYGINQFTHRSGSLLEVVNAYLENGGQLGRAAIEEALPLLRQKSAGAIGTLAANARFKKALKAAAVTSEMRSAQHEIAERRYLRPAIDAAEGSSFTLPLSLAVIYDSINHGSYARIRDRVKIARRNYASDIEFEKAWVYSYVKNRDAWLESVPRLAVTDYRTDFFLAQIARGNWMLELPVNVHGVKLERVDAQTGRRGEGEPDQKSKIKIQNSFPAVEPMDPTSELLPQTVSTPIYLPEPPENIRNTAQPPDVFSGGVMSGGSRVASEEASVGDEETRAYESEPGTVVTGSTSEKENHPGPTGPPLARHEGSLVSQAGDLYERAAGRFDRVSDVVSGISTRKDAAKSMWTTIGSTLWQSVWAVAAFVIGLPREVWLTVAIIAGAFALYYLYRQISLGKIREKKL